jgi:hypothetical protein
MNRASSNSETPAPIANAAKVCRSAYGERWARPAARTAGEGVRLKQLGEASVVLVGVRERQGDRVPVRVGCAHLDALLAGALRAQTSENGPAREAAYPRETPRNRVASSFPPLPRNARHSAEKPGGLEVPGSNPGARLESGGTSQGPAGVGAV